MSHVALEKFERSQVRTDVPEFRPGDTVRVNFRVREGDRERIQAFEGICIRRAGGGHAETITVRKISSGIGVERSFFLSSPLVESIEVRRKGHVRRARLYYLRDRFGKRARVRGSKKFMLKRDLEAAAGMATIEEAPVAQEPAIPADEPVAQAEPETSETPAEETS
ncbi:MAG: 50S ribosomal protein L19, partial [Candidatus Omnitrophica bacterium]|nr:50S ribosomal protein L19 [Candidatus Omnitrophota bacterium]